MSDVLEVFMSSSIVDIFYYSTPIFLFDVRVACVTSSGLLNLSALCQLVRWADWPLLSWGNLYVVSSHADYKQPSRRYADVSVWLCSLWRHSCVPPGGPYQITGLGAKHCVITHILSSQSKWDVRFVKHVMAKLQNFQSLPKTFVFYVARCDFMGFSGVWRPRVTWWQNVISAAFLAAYMTAYGAIPLPMPTGIMAAHLLEGQWEVKDIPLAGYCSIVY